MMFQKKNVINHFKTVFNWLNKHNMLSEEGKEILKSGIDESISLHERLVTKDGLKFLKKHYDEYLKIISKNKNMKGNNIRELEKLYIQYKETYESVIYDQLMNTICEKYVDGSINEQKFNMLIESVESMF